jgi:hypothetical protein
MAVSAPIAEIIVLLFFADRIGSMRGFVSFSEWGVGLSVSDIASRFAERTQIPLETLSLQQRCTVSALAALCALCTALMLFQLRSLFALYSRGQVFTAANIQRIKAFGMWLVAGAIVANVAGRIFVAVTHAPVTSTANAAMAVLLGVMIYVIAHVMELGRAADLERKEFI